MIDRNAVYSRLHKAVFEISELMLAADKNDRWRQGIPARPGYDTDCILTNALEDIDALLALHTALTARLAALEFDALVAAEGPTTEARNGGWVSVEEGLPEDRDELYLIWAASDAIHRIAFPPRKSQTAVTWWDDPTHGFCPVSHWQPLPDPPKP